MTKQEETPTPVNITLEVQSTIHNNGASLNG